MTRLTVVSRDGSGLHDVEGAHRMCPVVFAMTARLAEADVYEQGTYIYSLRRGARGPRSLVLYRKRPGEADQREIGALLSDGFSAITAFG